MIRSVALAALLLCGISTAAHAGIPIPCTGETIVHVLDVPATKGLEISANKDMDTKVLNLGYKLKNCFWGEWVGHIGSSSRYLPLSDDALKMLLTAAGRTEPPARPTVFTYPGANWYFWLWVVAFAWIVLAAIFKKPAAPTVEGEAAMAKVAEANPRANASPPPPPQRPAPGRGTQSTPANRMPVAARMALPAGARQGFGRR
jgi:hypothetical protein